MRRMLYSFLATAVLAAPALAQTSGKGTRLGLSGGNTKVEFVGSKPEGKHEGGFKELTGTATLRGDDLTTLKIDVDIETTSLYSDDAKLTGHLKSPDFFNVAKHPKAKFVSTRVEKTTTGHVVAGKLTMLGETKEVSFPAKITLTDKALLLTASFKIDRTEWGMSHGKGKIDNEVALSVSINAKR